MVAPLAVHQEPESRLYKALHRVADRMEPGMREAFLEAVRNVEGEMDEEKLLSALKRKDGQAVVQALGLSRMRAALQRGLENDYLRAMIAAGQANTQEAVRAGVFEMTFNVTNPNAVLTARQEVGTLITQVSEETVEAVRTVTSDMFTEGIPPVKASREIRTVVGLHSRHAKAVRNFRRQLEAGNLAAVDRRLDAATKARIRSAIRRDAVTPEFVDEVAETYRTSLLNRRAQDIARTESMRAAHSGQQESWRQAVRQGHLDAERTRRHWIVTPDDRLRETHAAVPGMNEDGVGLEEPFETPVGTAMYPPLEPNCRCSVGLSFKGGAGVL